MNSKSIIILDLVGVVSRARNIIDENDYPAWHADAERVLKDAARFSDANPTAPIARKAIQIAQAFDSESKVDVTVALCNDGAILKYWSKDKGWEVMPPIPQPGAE